MGIWEMIGSTAEAVKRNAPDATSLKNACISSYNYGSAAVTPIDRTVRINGLYRLGQWVPHDETRSQIALYTTKLAKNAGLYALQESYKLVPGGVAVSNIVTKTLKEVEHENLKIKKLNMSEDKVVVATEKQFINGRKSNGVSDDTGVVSATDRNPEDVIRVFMMKEFFGARFFDDLMVHELARGRGKKNE